MGNSYYFMTWKSNILADNLLFKKIELFRSLPNCCRSIGLNVPAILGENKEELLSNKHRYKHYKSTSPPPLHHPRYTWVFHRIFCVVFSFPTARHNLTSVQRALLLISQATRRVPMASFLSKERILKICIAPVPLNLNKFYIFDKWMQEFAMVLVIKLLISLNDINFSWNKHGALRWEERIFQFI